MRLAANRFESRKGHAVDKCLSFRTMNAPIAASGGQGPFRRTSSSKRCVPPVSCSSLERHCVPYTVEAPNRLSPSPPPVPVFFCAGPTARRLMDANRARVEENTPRPCRMAALAAGCCAVFSALFFPPSAHDGATNKGRANAPAEKGCPRER